LDGDAFLLGLELVEGTTPRDTGLFEATYSFEAMSAGEPTQLEV
jgi:hypothetical protein